jgi:hypothetical protein
MSKDENNPICKNIFIPFVKEDIQQTTRKICKTTTDIPINDTNDIYQKVYK